MEIFYNVTSCNETDFAVIATVAGVETPVKVSGLVVEMTSEDGSMGHTYKFIPTDMAASVAEFAVGNRIKVTLALDA